MNKKHIIHPKHCFCQVSNDELKPWVDKRYKEHYSTMELLSRATNKHDIELISIVALLDVDDKTMLKMM